MDPDAVIRRQRLGRAAKLTWLRQLSAGPNAAPLAGLGPQSLEGFEGGLGCSPGGSAGAGGGSRGTRFCGAGGRCGEFCGVWDAFPSFCGIWDSFPSLGGTRSVTGVS